MAGTSVQMQAEKRLRLSEIYRKLCQITDVEEVAKNESTVQGVSIWTLVFEKYYFRSGSYASATVVLTEFGQTQTACVVASGGGSGVVNFSFGANRHFAKDCLKVLEDCGFAVTDSGLKKGGFLEKIFD